MEGVIRRGSERLKAHAWKVYTVMLGFDRRSERLAQRRRPVGVRKRLSVSESIPPSAVRHDAMAA